MKQIFADTLYWAALLNPKDQWHSSAKEIHPKLADAQIVTTESVAIELLNFLTENNVLSDKILYEIQFDSEKRTRELFVELAL